MNRYFLVALILIVGAMALGDLINDGVLSITIGIGVAFTIVGLFQLYGKKRNSPSKSAE